MLKDDLQPRIEEALRAHAQAVQAGFADRAEQIKAQLQAYANQLSRMRGGAVSG